MVTLRYEPIKAFDQIVTDGHNACKSGPAHNLLLAYEFSPDLLNSDFVKFHEPKAREWQTDPPPSNLFFSHAQYFYGERGLQYVIEELKSKSNSRRALLSLANMDVFMGSGDRAIPSFMIAQFAIQSDVLYVTEYYRAIEVSQFLPINLAEAALLVKRIIDKVSRPNLIRLCVLAFQAHLTESFHCLEKAPLDMLKGAEIGVEVSRKNLDLLIDWLEGKKWFESEIATQGLEELLAAVTRCADQYSSAFRSHLAEALQTLQEIKKMRGSSSLESNIESHRKQYVRSVDNAISWLRSDIRGA